MSLSISPQMRVVLLLAGLAGAGFFVWLTMLSGGGAAASAAAPHLNPHPFGKRTFKAAAAKHASAGKRVPAATSAGAAKHAVAAKHVAAAAAKHAAAPLAPPTVKRVKKPAAPRPAVAADGLPIAVSDALAKHDVVVVLLFNPEAKVDQASAGEAQAAAKLVNAGFVAVNVLQKSEVEALSERYQLLSDPAVLVFRRPGDLVTQFTGFVDRETVAQAAQSAAQGGAR